MKFPLKTFVVENEDMELDVLLKRLKPEYFKVFAEATFNGALQTLKNETEFNASILDVRLENHKTCWDLIDMFGQKKFGVMAFTSAYGELRMEYIPKHHIPLLLTKPHNSKSVDNLINELIGVVRELNNGMPYEHVFITVNRKYLFLKAEQILYFRANDEYAWIYYWSDNKKEPKEELIKTSLSSLKKILDNRTFLNIRRSYIFNLNYISDLIEGDLLTFKFSLELKVVIYVRRFLKKIGSIKDK